MGWPVVSGGISITNGLLVMTEQSLVDFVEKHVFFFDAILLYLGNRD
jgi:hypothetical protein